MKDVCRLNSSTYLTNSHTEEIPLRYPKPSPGLIYFACIDKLLENQLLQWHVLDPGMQYYSYDFIESNTLRQNLFLALS